MKLLMVTRKIDRDDWLAGHSYEWARALSEELKKSGGSLKVICLGKGNIEGLEAEVYSLGKEWGVSRWRRYCRLFGLSWKLVRQGDGIFCHQNPEYAIVMAPAAFVFRKQIVSWYTHKSVTWKTRLMLAVSKSVLTASKESFRIPSAKVQSVGHGIDTEKFKAPENRTKGNKYQIITVGRISPVKDLETMLLAVKELVQQRKEEDIKLHIIGDTGLPEQESYLQSLKDLVSNSGLGEHVAFEPSVPHERVQEVYQGADLFLNMSQTGSLDKAVLEAMASQCPVITANEAFSDMLSPFAEWTLTKQNDQHMLAEKILAIKNFKPADLAALTGNLRRIVVESHSLEKLASVILSNF